MAPPQLQPMALITTASMEELTFTDCLNFGKNQDRWDNFLDAKMNANNWTWNTNSSRKMTKDFFNLYKISHWESQRSSNSCIWDIFWSMKQKTLAERKICLQYRYQQCPKTWTNNSNCFTWLLALWIVQAQKLSPIMLQYTMNKPKSSYTHFRILARKTEQEKYLKIVFSKNKLEEFLELFVVLKSVNDEVIANRKLWSARKQVMTTF